MIFFRKNAKKIQIFLAKGLFLCKTIDMSILKVNIQSVVLTSMSTIVTFLTIGIAGKVVDKISDMHNTSHASVVETTPEISSFAKNAERTAQSSASLVASLPKIEEYTKEIIDTAEAEEEKSVETHGLHHVPVSRTSVADTSITPSITHGDVFPWWMDDDMRTTDWSLDFLAEGNTSKYQYGPKLHAKSAFIVDIDSGEILWQKAPDSRRPAASLTKVLSSFTLATSPVGLDTSVCVDYTIRIGVSGAHTRLSPGDCVSGWDVLGAALVSSDNGAAFSFPLIADQTHDQFAEEMNRVAESLQMTQSEFVDPAGVYDENISTARDITKLSIAAAHHPWVSMAASARQWYAQIGDEAEIYNTTNKAIDKNVDFLLAKTGYTDTARCNFTAVYQERNGRRIAFTILGSWNKKRRLQDIFSVMEWVQKH